MHSCICLGGEVYNISRNVQKPKDKPHIINIDLGYKSQSNSAPRPSGIQAQPPKDRRARLSKKRVRKKAAENIPVVCTPISELAKKSDIPAFDIQSYANRSGDARRDEVKNGKIKRPLNAFMLYRKAYQDHLKKHYTLANNRLISQVCGASWTLEPEPIRTKFVELARVERAKHTETWPEYKFSPTKRRQTAFHIHSSNRLACSDW